VGKSLKVLWKRSFEKNKLPKHIIPTILVAPLDWGLGHATRCIPLIDKLLQHDITVVLATDGRAYTLLQQQYPTLTLLKLPAYNIRYRSSNMTLAMASQFPKIVYAIVAEHIALKKIIRQHGIRTVISDNRYGLFHRKVHNVFLTHQLNLIIPNPLLQTLVRKGLNRWIRLFFDSCWIPDVAEEPSLSGILSHPALLPSVAYIGSLSRMQRYEVEKEYDVIAVLSGPEPQRTFLENEIIAQAKNLTTSFLIVGGKPEMKEVKQFSHNVQYVSFLDTVSLNRAMLAANVVISRSGYSTIMDLAKLKKKAILIPTPGQTEQEYLAHHFMEKNIFLSQPQDKLNLASALDKLDHYTGFLNDSFGNHRLEELIVGLLEK
jgi:predicted glycosyltransferase